MRPLRPLGVLVALAPALGAGQLTASEREGIADAMLVGNLRPQDLRFARSPFSDPRRMPLVTRALDDVLGTADALLELHATAGATPAAGLLERLAREAFGDSPVVPPPAPADPALQALPEPVRAPVARLVSAVAAATAEVRAATSGLTPGELRQVVEGLPTLALETDRIRLSFVRAAPAGRERLLELVGRIDLARIRAAGARLTTETETQARALRAVRIDWRDKVRLTVNGMPIVVAGVGDDVHTETDARVTIDFGGNDVYRGRHGAGVGYAAVLIDLGGDDQYNVPDLNVGAGVAGIGVAASMGGNDTFRGGSVVFGAGIAGVGVLVKEGGDDEYRSRSMAQGFGMFGVGLLLDTAGNDRYDVALCGQGAARTQGVGWSVDREGDDVYRAGGLLMNEPLFTGVSYSFAQGFASGFREDTGGVSGGIGLLTDAAGNDAYYADTYAQAASYWFSLGSLGDLAGNDVYTAHHYSQASAMHCCAAYLFDLSGDDAYVTKVGASLAIGHDYGVAFLVDRAGDDLYSARDGTPGIGTANGLGVFVDGGGDDRYDGPPGQGQPARGTGSLGLFVDLGGEDRYRRGLSDGHAAAVPTWGVAYDAADTVAMANPPSTESPPVPGSRPMPSASEMEALYARATRWGVGSAEGDVRSAVRTLVEIGLPALEWMLDERLAEADRLQIRAFVAVVRGIGGPQTAASLGARALAGTKAEVRNLLAIASEVPVTDFGTLVPGWLDDPELRLPAARAAGALQARGAVPGLMRLLLDGDRFLVRAAMVSLAQIGDPASSSTAQAMADHPDLPTRMAALQLLARFPEEAEGAAERWAADPDEFRARLGLQVLGRIGSARTLEKVADCLLDPRPGVRIEAILQLKGRFPADRASALEGLRKDPVPVVRAVAERVAGGP